MGDRSEKRLLTGNEIIVFAFAAIELTDDVRKRRLLDLVNDLAGTRRVVIILDEYGIAESIGINLDACEAFLKENSSRQVTTIRT